jgi:hypothetical protein
MSPKQIKEGLRQVVCHHHNGEVSHRKVISIICFAMICCGYAYHLITGRQVDPTFTLIFASLSAIGLGYMTAENIVELFRKNAGE